MELQLAEVLESKVYIQDKSQITFGSPKSYIEPFLDIIEKANLKVNYRVSVSERTANREAESEKINAAYGRVCIEAKLPEQYTVKNHDSVIGMVYALDTQKPTIRVYSGENAWACTNLAIFGARYIHQVDLMGGASSIYDKSLEFVEGIAEQLARFQRIYEYMNDTILVEDQIDKEFGRILRAANKNKFIGTNPVLSALKDLEDPKSKYAIKEGRTTQWNMYSALTQYVTDKVDILEKSSKTVLLSNLFVADNIK